MTTRSLAFEGLVLCWALLPIAVAVGASLGAALSAVSVTLAVYSHAIVVLEAGRHG